MKKNKLSFPSLALITILFVSIFSCNKTVVSTSEKMDEAAKSSPMDMNAHEIFGKWKLTGVFLSDATAGPCISDVPAKDITIDFTKGIKSSTTNVFLMNGQSVVNLYFSAYTLGKYDATLKHFGIKIEPIGRTKIAGTEEMNQCEQGYIERLMQAESYKVIQNEQGKPQLLIGRFRKPTDHPRDGGLYMIYEKI